MHRAMLLIVVAIGAAAGESLTTPAIAKQVSTFDRVPGGLPYRIPPGSGYLELETALVRLAQRAGVPTGLERSYRRRDFRPSPELFDTDFSAISLRDASQILQRFDPEYDARMLNEVLVIRPVEEWARRDHPLHRRIPQFEVHAATLPDLTKRVAALLGADNEPYVPSPGARLPIGRWTFQRSGASVLEILNSAATQSDGLSWLYDHEPGPGPFSLFLETTTTENYRVGWR
jgi:hypothetical protein